MTKRLLSIVFAGIMLFYMVPVKTLAGDVFNISVSDESSATFYYNYYYINDAEYDYVDLYSVNNSDPDALWRPKYDDVATPIEEFVQFYDKELKVHINGFDVDWSVIDKSKFESTNRALEILGYDFLAFEESVDTETGEITRVMGQENYISAPYFIMNIYKALGIELYDICFKFDPGTSNCGVSVTRTNPDSYWQMFLNDHPIDYDVYNEYNLDDIYSSPALSIEDAIAILAQMLDFYGEPVISKQEEYMLLQVYGDDVPVDLSETMRHYWSYLKCRGIIGEEEYSYKNYLTMDVMLELLMRAADKDSRTNFKEVQITTSLSDEFIKEGFYKRDTTISVVPSLEPTGWSAFRSGVTTKDFLIEIGDNEFYSASNGELTMDLFASAEPNYNSKPFKGSIFHGIVDGGYYHFEIPVSELEGVDSFYINSSSGGDTPLNYTIPDTLGGVYFNGTNNDGYVMYTGREPFDVRFPDVFYSDQERMDAAADVALGASIQYVISYNTEMLDTEATESAIKTAFPSSVVEVNGDTISIQVEADASLGNISVGSYLAPYLRFKEEYKISSTAVNESILGINDDDVLVSTDYAKEVGIIKGYTVILDSDKLILYKNDNSTVIIDNKYKTIQNGQTYFKLDYNRSLFTVEDNVVYVDFRALFGYSGAVVNLIGSGSSVEVSFISTGVFYKSTSDGSGYTSQGTVYVTEGYRLNGSAQTVIRYSGDPAPVCSGSEVMSLTDEKGNIYVPMASYNVLGNYILYGYVDPSTAAETYYLVRMYPKGVIDDSINKTKDKELKDMFYYMPNEELLSNYDVLIDKIDNSNTMGLTFVKGIGWCAKVPKVDSESNLSGVLSSIMANDGTCPIPLAAVSTTTSLFSLNYNYISDDSYKARSFSNTTFIPSIVSIQSLFTDPSIVPTISTTNLSSFKNDKIRFYLGSLELKLEGGGGKFEVNGTSKDYSLINTMTKDVVILGTSTWQTYGGETTDTTYKYPVSYSCYPSGVIVALNEVKDEEYKKVSSKLLGIEEFFNEFNKLTFEDFIQGVDNVMFLLYYIGMRIVPFLIMILLLLILMLTMVADAPIFVAFCDKYIDIVKILTFGNHTVHTVRNKFTILYLIIGLALMGFVQAGNLEKIIIWLIHVYYAIISMF